MLFLRCLVKLEVVFVSMCMGLEFATLFRSSAENRIDLSMISYRLMTLESKKLGASIWSYRRAFTSFRNSARGSYPYSRYAASTPLIH
jgi:hypothetical protein